MNRITLQCLKVLQRTPVTGCVSATFYSATSTTRKENPFAKENKMRREIILILGIIVLTVSSAGNSACAAENSNIEGHVWDAQTKSPLPGANVMLKGTSLGASTDLNGRYVIRNVPPGSYVIRAAYIGYRNQELPIRVKRGGEIRRDFRLEAVGVQGKTVVVTGQASGQNAAINQQLSSDRIMNSVSAARIQELPDANAAESVGRLPGVSLIREGGEGASIVIRGLAPQYNQILIDGVQMAATDVG
ncbi:MAG: carboxypeptidase-like regulatory domain-containing protein, partial [Bacteroidetes bacterium]|nr:carboxypeptidase-like regulatory domain-containing protein [Bacteroidota bacterium]